LVLYLSIERKATPFHFSVTQRFLLEIFFVRVVDELSRIFNCQAEEIDAHSAAAFAYGRSNTDK
jgi:hypothetical protein